MKSKWFDSLIGIVGLATSLVIYYFQSRSAPVIDFIIVLLPTLLALSIIILRLIIIVAKYKWKEFREAKRFYDMITGTRCSTFTTLRIINTDGDASYDRLVKYRITKSNIKLQETATYTLSSTSPNICEALPADSIVSNIIGIELKPIIVSQGDVQIHTKKFHRSRWRYRIEPALNSKGDSLSFRFHKELPESERDAFTENGSTIYVVANATYADIGISLISPPKYQIKIIDAFFEDINGTREEIAKDNNPSLAGNQEILDWKPRYKAEGRYVCRYKVLMK